MKRLLLYVAIILLLFATNVAATNIQLAALSQAVPPAVVGDWRAGGDDSLYAHRRFASCRVQVNKPRLRSNGAMYVGYGSGTVINKRTLSNGKTVGLVVTCAHIFPAGWTAEQAPELSPKAQFPLAAKTNPALVLAIDWNNDISVWAIYVKKDQPVIPLAVTPTGETYNVCGFGPDAVFRSRCGKLMGYVSASWNGGGSKEVPAGTRQTYVTDGHNQLYVQASGVYVGDSGGGIITQDNKLAAVLWGGSGMRSFGTYSGTIKQFLKRRLPPAYQWGNSPCPLVGEGSAIEGVVKQPTAPPLPAVTIPRQVPNYPTPDLDPLPSVPVIPKAPALPASEDYETIITALAKIQQDVDALKAQTSAFTQGQKQAAESFVQLRDQLSELAGREQAVTITVQSPKFISPSYVDVSVLWALQQGSGIDHVVLITDTAATQWQQLNSEYESALKQFPAIVLFDIASSGIEFKELPQLVVYPVNPDKQPVIVKGVDSVVKKLQVLTSDAPGGFLGTE